MPKTTDPGGLTPVLSLLAGMLVAGLIAGAAVWLERSSNPPPVALTPAQQEELRQRVFDDLPNRDPVRLDRATSLTDLPAKRPKKPGE